MFLSNISIERPVFATMLNVVLIVFGLFSLPRLPVDQFPNVDFPVVSVSVVYPGADPESVEQRILDPLEDAVNGIGGLKNLMSNAFPNIGQIVLQFELEKNGDQAAQEVRDKVFAALSLLPQEAETPIVQKFDVGGQPIMSVAITGEKMPFADLSTIAKDIIQPELERVAGVARLNTAGIREREVQVYIDRDRLASFGVSASDVINSIQQQNLDMPAGKIETSANYWSVRVKGRLSNGEEIGRLPIVSQSGATLSVQDVATVVDSIAEEETAAFLGRTPTILMSLLKQSGSNTTAVADGVRAALANLKKQLPPDVNVDVVSDNSVYVKGSIDSVKLDLVLGAVLATFIVLVFLRSFWVTVISAVALPTAVIATFAFLQAMGFSLNMMTTLGLSLSIGILIDDAIIVIENIARHLGMGKSGAAAARDATAEIGIAVMATTLTICAVFVPVAFMEGIIGRFFYQFGLTVAFAVLVSLFVAFTLTPMLSSRLLHEGEHGPPQQPQLKIMWRAIEDFLTKMDNSYRSLLEFCLRYRKSTVFMGVGIFILSIIMLSFVPVSFFPKEDRSQIVLTYTLPEGTALEESKKRGMELVGALEQYPGVDKIISAYAATQDRKPNKVRFDVILVDKADRGYTQFELMNRLRDDLGPVFGKDGAELLVSEAGGNEGGGRTQPVQIIFKADDYEALSKFTDDLVVWAKDNVPGLADVSSSRPKSQGEFRIEVDSGRAADLAVSTAQIAMTVRSLYEGAKISEIEDRGTTFDVRLRIADRDRLTAGDIAAIPLTNRRGQQITLGSIARIVEASAPSMVERFNGQRQITFLSNFVGKDLNKATDQLQARIEETMPAGITSTLSGQAEIMKNSITAMLRALVIAILLVYMILCAQYERYLAPLVIMAALPLSFTGAFGALLITGQVMSVYTMIGIILLMGIVTKNGILLIDFTLQRVRDGLTVDAALLEAGPIRLRPILMTTFAAGGGMLPIAIGHGVGGEARSPMGVAVIGGLLMSTLLTLVVVPCLFSWVESLLTSFKTRFKSLVGGKKVPAAAH